MSTDRTDQLPAVKRAILELRRLRARLAEVERSRSEPIAIVGMGLRLPGGSVDADTFWRLLDEGRDAISEVPSDRWDCNDYYDPNPDAPGKMTARHGGFVDGVDRFDAHFFGIAPREAISMDPQHRLVLETAWEALEDAGAAPARLAGTQTGVFIGLSNSDYNRLLGSEHERIDAYYSLGTTASVAAGRLSYLLGLHGPSLAVDTACSSSLVAVHLACQSLLNGESDLALAGGVNLILTPELNINFSKARMLAPDGRCKTFDDSADGYVRSEGCAVVVLKRLSDALRDRDRLLALVRGSAVNQDGRSGGLTAPNGPAQEAVIARALAAAGVAPRDVQYVEAHGTGTPLGDPIEVYAVARAFGEGRDPADPVVIGSVKTNIGHLEAAAGVAGLIKVVLALGRERIPRHLNARTLNTHVAWSELPVRVALDGLAWRTGARARLAGVSSFGFSGTNAHLVVEEAPPAPVEANALERPRHVLAVSARSSEALRVSTSRLAERLTARPDLAAADVCFTAGAGRSHHEQRVAVTGAALAELRDALAAFARGDPEIPNLRRGEMPEGRAPEVVFLFPGHGSQYAAMGRELYDTQPTFRRALDRCDAIARDDLGRSLVSILFDPEGEALIHRTAFTQPALFAVEYSLAELWRSWGVQPAVVAGHSLGEDVAGCVAGVFSLEDGLRLMIRRGRLMQDLEPLGAMVSLFASEARVREAIGRLGADVAVAAVNGPEHTVISGPADVVVDVTRSFEGKGIKSRRLPSPYACHSRLMDPILGDLAQAASRIAYRRPGVPMISNVSGAFAGDEELTAPGYWVQHVRQPVRFSDTIETLRRAGHTIFLEVGPGATLTALGRRCSGDARALWRSSIREEQSDWSEMTSAVAELYARGVSIDWTGFDGDYRRAKVALPTYPFERQRYWAQRERVRTKPAPESVSKRADARAGEGLLGRRLRSSVVKAAVFETTIGVRSMPDLRDHCVQGQPHVPAAIYVELALEAAARLGVSDASLADVSFQAPLAFADTEERIVQTVIDSSSARDSGDSASPGGTDLEFQVLSSSEENADRAADPEWTCHVVGRIRAGMTSALPGARSARIASIEAGVELDGDEYYDRLRTKGIAIGSSYRAIVRLQVGARGATADLRGPADGGYLIPPALFDACCHVAGTSVAESIGAADETFLLARLSRVHVLEPPAGSVLCRASVVAGAAPSGARADAELIAPDGRLLARLEGLEFRRARSTVSPLRPDWLYEVAWLPVHPGPSADTAIHPQFAVPAVAAAAAAEAERIEREPDHRACGKAIERLEALSTAYIHAALRDLRWCPSAGESIDPGALGAELGVTLRQSQLFRRMLEILAADGFLTGGPIRWVVERGLDDRAPDPLRAEIVADHALVASELELTARCGQELAGVLRGEVNPVELLFPGGSFGLVERVYSESSGMRLFAGIIRQAATAALARLPAGRPLRILEVGAGTGSLTSSVLPLLPKGRSRYVFTDVSTVFTTRAQERFREYPFIDYRLLDIALDPAAQGFTTRFDLVLAANVLHATPDLRATLAHVRQLLAPGGVTMIVESVRKLRWLDITFGMTEGWWLARDDGAREGHPLLSGGAWVRLLGDIGFEHAAALPGGEAAGHSWASQALLVAQAPAASADAAPSRADQGTWIVLADRAGVARQFSRRAIEAGEQCVIVEAFDPASFAQYDTLFAADPPAKRFKGIVHCWNLDAPPVDQLDDASLERARESGCASVLWLVQALVRQPRGARVWVATCGAQAIAGRVTSPAQAPVWGLGRAIALEHPELWGGLIDLPAGVSAADAGDELWFSVNAGDDEDQVAIHHGVRHGARLVRTRCDASPLPIGADGSYLVTGGLGGLGRGVARWLAAQGARHLVLAGRRGLHQGTTAAADRDAAEALALVDGLRQEGVAVVPVAVDVGEERQLAALIARFGRVYPRLRGVLHLATAHGIAGVTEMSLDALRAMLRPKVAGTWALDRLTRGLGLDFFVLFSSTTGLLGSKGLAHYAAANAFVDAVAHVRREAGEPAVSIDWGSWEVMRRGSAEWERLVAQSGLRPMPSARALDALGALLGTTRAQIAVADVDWGIVRSVFEARGRRPFLERLEVSAAPPVAVAAGMTLAARLESLAGENRREALVAYVRGESASVLALDAEQVDVGRGLFDMGMDSLMSVELKARLEKGTGRRLPTTLTFNYPSVGALAAFLEREMFGGRQDAAGAGRASRESTDAGETVATGSSDDDLSEEELEALLVEKLTRL